MNAVGHGSRLVRAPKILLVDDDPVTLRIFSKALESAGLYQIRTATDGDEGMREALAFRPHLIISDKVMPRMDGLEFCRQVKRSPALASCIFVILTSVAEPGARVQGLEGGADDYLVKPLPAEELKARVHSILRRPSSEEAPAHLSIQFTQMLAQVMDLMWSGAANRAMQVRAAAEWIAEDLAMPAGERLHLALAANLQEIGKIGLHQKLLRLSRSDMVAEDWTRYRVYPSVSNILLRNVDAFQAPGLIVRHLFENWDGSGFPDHLQQGRIPLGSRILRLLVDFFEDFDRISEPASRGARIEHLLEGREVLYDPAVCRALSQYVLQELDASMANNRRYLAVEDLLPGMKLAADLVTSSGALLLKQDEVLTEAVVRRIVRHHSFDPFLFSICVYPK